MLEKPSKFRIEIVQKRHLGIGDRANTDGSDTLKARKTRIQRRGGWSWTVSVTFYDIS